MMMALRSWLGTRLISRDFALFTAGSFVFAMGTWFRAVTVSWLGFQLTGSTFYLGLISFAQLAPVFFFGLLGGVLADRMDRRQLILATAIAVSVVNAVLALLSVAGWLTAEALFFLVLALGLTGAVMMPAWSPFIKDLVPHSRLREAVALNAARFNLTRVLTPALAGGLLAIAGPSVCLAISAVGSLGVVLAVLAIHPRRLERSRPVPWWSALGEGLDYARDEVNIRLLIVLTGAFGLLAMPSQALLPAYTERELGLGPEGLGTLFTAVGAGGIIGALISGSRHTTNREYRAMGGFAAAAGLGLLLLGVAPSLAVVLVALGLVGLGSIGFLTAATATIQLIVPDLLVGRVMSLYVAMNAGAVPLGSLAFGGMAEQVGVRMVMLIGGIGALLVSLPLLLRRPPPEQR